MRPLSFLSGLTVGTLIMGSIVSAWTGPTQTAPAGNVSAPINVGSIDQVKNAGLGVNSLAVYGNAILNGSNLYLNFGSSVGTSTGYGIRDNAGALEFKNAGALWASLSTTISNYLVLNGLTMISGTATFNGNVNAVGFFHTSDARMKTNIKTINGQDIITHLRGVSFNWNNTNTPSVGVIAQEVEQVMPSAVHTDAQGMKSVDYDQLIGPLIESI